MQLLIGTNNKGKIVEISEALSGLDVDLVSPDDLGLTLPPPEETGDTFEDNAVLKARFYHDHAHIPTIADDSGIIVDALHDELGVHTRRWGAGPEASDEEWIAYFLDRMKNEENRRAVFYCVIAFLDEQGALQTFQGECPGVITEELQADYLPGLPFSGCFIPDGEKAVFSALNIEQKNSSSHRGRAALKLREYLKTTS